MTTTFMSFFCPLHFVTALVIPIYVDLSFMVVGSLTELHKTEEVANQ